MENQQTQDLKQFILLLKDYSDLKTKDKNVKNCNRNVINAITNDIKIKS